VWTWASKLWYLLCCFNCRDCIIVLKLILFSASADFCHWCIEVWCANILDYL
jgi:hypothetical protein